MKISKLPPPIAVAEGIRRVFNQDFENGDLAVAYGDTVHVLSGSLAPDVEVHEAVHLKQQEKMGPAAWWDLYFTDEEFRLAQEIEAYKAQYFFIWRRVKDRNRVNASLQKLAGYLSGPMYGKMCSMSDAIAYIKGTKAYVLPEEEDEDE